MHLDRNIARDYLKKLRNQCRGKEMVPKVLSQ